MSWLRVYCQTLERWLIRGWLVIAALSLALILTLSLGQILARNFFHTGFPDADDVIRRLVMWVVFAGASIAVHTQRHIKIDALNQLLPDAWQRALLLPLHLFSSAICAALALAAAHFWWGEWQVTAPADQVSTALLLIFPVGFAALALDFLVRAGAGPQSAS